ncbi:MAG: SAM-dependent methyltransferase [Lachnospiraceae bacterium]|nr:SAM-dependent methyltransferase [Lachnospiraceae bacterium]
MKQLLEILDQSMDENLIRIILSNKRKTEAAQKVVIRPFENRGNLCFQFETYRNNQVFHDNYSKPEAIKKVEELLTTVYKQIEITAASFVCTALVSKKGKSTIRKKQTEAYKKLTLTHNRKKAYILPEREPVPFLVELGVQTKEGKVIDKKHKKFRQINRFLEFVRDVLPRLEKGKRLTILDFGCGKSYLTFALYHYLKIMEGYEVNMIGLDLKEEVIRNCNRLAEKLGYDDLTFLQGDISSYEGVDTVDMVVTLHACDTATDFALDKAVRWGAKVILSVPCCQHEINRQISGELLQPVLKYGVLKEKIAALITDGLRANLLEQKGYEVQILEFIDTEHTPKNLMIRAIKGKGKKPAETTAYQTLCDSMNLHGTLEKLMQESENQRRITE